MTIFSFSLDPSAQPRPWLDSPSHPSSLFRGIVAPLIVNIFAAVVALLQSRSLELDAAASTSKYFVRIVRQA
jgi:hypothetical protein